MKKLRLVLRAALVCAAALGITEERAEATIVADLRIGGDGTTFSHATATGNSAYGRILGHNAEAHQGVPPALPTSLVYTENTYATVRGRSSDVYLGARSAQFTDDIPRRRATGTVTFTDELLINGPLELELDVIIRDLAAFLTDPQEGTADALIEMQVALMVENPFPPIFFPEGGWTPTIALAERWFVAGASDSPFGREEWYRISETRDGAPLEFHEVDIIPVPAPFTFRKRHSFTFDPALAGPFFPGGPLEAMLQVMLRVETDCNIDGENRCRARVEAWDSASVKLTGDYVSAGGFQYQGLDGAAVGGEVPEPGSLGLAAIGVLLIAVHGLKLRRKP